MHYFDILLRCGVVVVVFFLRCEMCACALFFPTNSAYGIFAAIAVPLDLPHRNVFVSYNFEANYNLPYTWNVPPIKAGIEDEDLFDEVRKLDAATCTNCTSSVEEQQEESLETTTSTNSSSGNSTSSTETASETPPETDAEAETSRERRSLLTRTHFYHILKDKFQRSGYSGESCLLRLICETNASALGEINGVLGSLVHIIFAPSTSASEELPLAYYQAEADGAHHGDCAHYAPDCTENLIDLISAPLHEIVNSLTQNKYRFE